jgi:hypothetical protein
MPDIDIHALLPLLCRGGLGSSLYDAAGLCVDGLLLPGKHQGGLAQPYVSFVDDGDSHGYNRTCSTPNATAASVAQQADCMLLRSAASQSRQCDGFSEETHYSLQETDNSNPCSCTCRQNIYLHRSSQHAAVLPL